MEMAQNIVKLERFAYTPMGTFGRLKVGDFEFFTVERPWVDNEPFKSCVLEGEYELLLDHYHKGG